jgi:hypothetical protein
MQLEGFIDGPSVAFILIQQFHGFCELRSRILGAGRLSFELPFGKMVMPFGKIVFIQRVTD